QTAFVVSTVNDEGSVNDIDWEYGCIQIVDVIQTISSVNEEVQNRIIGNKSLHRPNLVLRIDSGMK
ncbi:hypothetical protein HHI36_001366, partial [Cryptolaemus montrouzieri]